MLLIQYLLITELKYNDIAPNTDIHLFFEKGGDTWVSAQKGHNVKSVEETHKFSVAIWQSLKQACMESQILPTLIFSLKDLFWTHAWIIYLLSIGSVITAKLNIGTYGVQEFFFYE